MESRIMQVFYGNDLLPYKDSERTIHYPIVGNSFAGSNLTNEIHFYIDQIGGTSGISWVIVSKLPNGEIGYEPLSTVETDSELGVDYLVFKLSSYYTQVKGDLYLALRRYQGEITFTDEDDDGIYQINGDPLIEVTGTIKLAINYSPMVNTGTQVLPTDIDRLIASLSNYSLIANTMTFANFNGSGKTIAELSLAINTDGTSKPRAVKITGITNSASYIGLINKSDNKYYLEFERYGSGVRASQDRWVARDLTGDELVEDVFTTYNDYYAPYLVNGNYFDYDSATFKDMHDNIGDVPHIVRITGTSTDSSNYGGFFLVKLSTGSLFAIRLSASSDGFKDMYFGTSISDNTALSAIFNHSSSYYKPYALQENIVPKLTTYYLDEMKAIVGNYKMFFIYFTDGDLQDYNGGYFCEFAGGTFTAYNMYGDIYSMSYSSGHTYFGDFISNSSNVYSLNATQHYVDNKIDDLATKVVNLLDATECTTFGELRELMGTVPSVVKLTYGYFLGKISGTTNSVNFEFEEISGDSTGRYFANRERINSSTLLSDIFTSSSAYYKPYALKDYVDSEIAQAISGVYQIKGSGSVVLLNAITANATDKSTLNGYVYNITDVGNLNNYSGTTPVSVGDNVVFVYNNGQWGWDKLASTIDLTGYVQKTTTIAGIDLQDNITAQELTDALVYATSSDIEGIMED